MNKMSLLAMAVPWLIGVGSLACADAPLIYCTGAESGGNGPTRYAYRVDAASFPMMEFQVPTSDLDRTNYTNMIMPPGWEFAVEQVPGSHAHKVKTPHGKVSPGPCRCLTAGSVRWWTEDPVLAVEFFTFGYDHPWVSEDVGWDLTTQRDGPPPTSFGFSERWDAPVGTGIGPVHGPSAIPEPNTFALLAIGSVILFARLIGAA